MFLLRVEESNGFYVYEEEVCLSLTCPGSYHTISLRHLDASNFRGFSRVMVCFVTKLLGFPSATLDCNHDLAVFLFAWSPMERQVSQVTEILLPETPILAER